MAHFAELDENNIVLRVVVVDNSVLNDGGVENEVLGINYLKNILGQDTKWVQTSYNNSFRKRFAGAGYSYNEYLDAFINPKPYDSWVFDENEVSWVAPIKKPEGDGLYTWDETNFKWVKW